jgi:hypothetical protein
VSERITFGDRRGWDVWLKLASIICTVIVVPGAGWAVSVHQQIGELDGRVRLLSAQLDSDRRSASAILDELKSLRSSVDTLRADVLQRITRVETKLEGR